MNELSGAFDDISFNGKTNFLEFEPQRVSENKCMHGSGNCSYTFTKREKTRNYVSNVGNINISYHIQ